MRDPVGEVVEGIDRAWLERAARADPVAHAFAVYDILYAPERVRFVSLREDGTTTAYLLLWYGGPVPVVHWVGLPPTWPRLLSGVPGRPLLAIVPTAVAGPLRERLGPGETYPIEVLARPPHRPPPAPVDPARVRPLERSQTSLLRALCDDEPELAASAYRTIDVGAEPVWGAFDGDRLVGVARTAVALPTVWMIGGVFTRPSVRRRGFGHELTAAVTRAAIAAGALPALGVRTDNRPARRIYDRLGFAPVDHRIWLDAGAHLAP
ncbi:MAG: GNAT family N-acetyltransferase [Thermoplasmata archaeon]